MVVRLAGEPSMSELSTRMTTMIDDIKAIVVRWRTPDTAPFDPSCSNEDYWADRFECLLAELESLLAKQTSEVCHKNQSSAQRTGQAVSAPSCGCPKEYHDVICPLGLRGSRWSETDLRPTQAVVVAGGIPCECCGRLVSETRTVNACADCRERLAHLTTKAGNDPRWTVSAYLTRGDRVLLVHHKKLGMWLPIGGGVEAGERPAEAVLREVREETGFSITEIDCLGFDEHWTGERIHMNLAHRARVLSDGDPESDGSWFGFTWLRIGDEPPEGTPKNVREALIKLGACTDYAVPEEPAVPRAQMRDRVRKAREFERERAAKAAEAHGEWAKESGRFTREEQVIIWGACQAVAREIRDEDHRSETPVVQPAEKDQGHE